MLWDVYKRQAYAALDILGIEKYAGDSREVKRYLNCKFDFYKDFVVKAQEMKNKSWYYTLL